MYVQVVALPSLSPAWPLSRGPASTPSAGAMHKSRALLSQLWGPVRLPGPRPSLLFWVGGSRGSAPEEHDLSSQVQSPWGPEWAQDRRYFTLL